ncbi:MAG: DNA-processing protein DprA [Dehalococcoidia bacterium]
MSRSEDSFAALLLASHLASSPAEPLGPREFWRLHDTLDGLGLLLSYGEVAKSAAADAGLNPERLDQLLGRGVALGLELESLDQAGIRAITPFDGEYPGLLRDRLGGVAPPVLYLAGEAQLLEGPALGVVGSRTTDSHSEEVARRAAQIAAEEGMTLVSGGAKGVDYIAMKAAFKAGGKVAGVLADSLVQKLRDPDNRAAIFDEQACFVTAHNPTLGFTVGNAMARNKLIYALAERTLVVRSDLETGGTWAGAVEAIKHRYGKVLVWLGEGAGPGNAELVKRGGHGIDDLEQLLSEFDEEAPPSTEQQLTLAISKD